MAELEVRLFGDVVIQHVGRSPPALTGKALELFCYLLVNRDRPHTRERLSEVLWPGGQSAVSKRYLRQALWRLTGSIQGGQNDAGPRAAPLLISDSGWVRINPDVPWWLDVSTFEQVHLSTRDVAGHHLSGAQAHRVESALDLYRGDLLAAGYDEWCGDERERLRLIYLSMLDQLVGYCGARRHYAKGVGLGQLVLRHDPAREPTHRQLMLLHYRAGDRVAALRQYERCAAVLADEFGVAPSAGTVALYEQIRADQVPDLVVPLSPGHPPASAGTGTAQAATDARDAIAGLHARLDQIHACLLTLQKSVSHTIGPWLVPATNGDSRGPAPES